MSSTRKRLESLTAGLSVPDFPAAALPVAAKPPAIQAPPVGGPGASQARFPESQVSNVPPRTGPGQMLAFRGQMQAVEGEIVGLRERLKQYENSMPSKRLDPKSIRLSKFANRHPASFSTAEFASLKSDIEHAGGNVQAILVRPLSAPDEGFELLFGHRRHRACLELGIPVNASIWLDPLTDVELFAVMDRENRERENLSPLEQGRMYAQALEENLFPTQRQLADGVGVSHTWVRKALMVAALPESLLECFSSPLDVTHRHAELLTSGLDRDRKAILKRAEKLRGTKLAPTVVVNRLLGTDAPEKALRASLVIDGKSIGSMARAKNGTVTVTLAPGAMDGLSVTKLSEGITDALARLAK